MLKNLLISSGLAVSTILCSSLIMPQSVKAQPSSCDWFTGKYKDLGIGVIVHIGGNRLIVYNGNPTPLDGRCISAEEIQVNFGNKSLTGKKARNSPDVVWSNRTIWRKESNTVNFPISGF
jgi:hypothetical protein